MEPSATPTPQAASIEKLVFNDVEAAVYLDMSVFTLRKWRTTGRGPVYICCGRLKKYRLADLVDFIESQKVAR